MLTVRLDSGMPLVEQIVRGLRDAIARGELAPGDELPSVRQLAGDLGVNLNTVARAYRELEAQGLVRTARGRGTRVTAAEESRRESGAEQRGRIETAIRAALADARLAGLPRREVARIISRAMRELWPSPKRKEIAR